MNPIACAGHGICAELLPERVTLDDWGFPIVSPESIPGELLPHARRAVAACPTLALVLAESSPWTARAASGRAGGRSHKPLKGDR